VKSKNAKIWIWLEFALKIGDRSTVIFKNLSCDCNYLDTKVILGSLESWNLIVAKIFWRYLEDRYFLKKMEGSLFSKKKFMHKIGNFCTVKLCTKRASNRSTIITYSVQKFSTNHLNHFTLLVFRKSNLPVTQKLTYSF
jgi:hypothetical protein